MPRIFWGILILLTFLFSFFAGPVRATDDNNNKGTLSITGPSDSLTVIEEMFGGANCITYNGTTYPSQICQVQIDAGYTAGTDAAKAAYPVDFSQATFEVTIAGQKQMIANIERKPLGRMNRVVLTLSDHPTIPCDGKASIIMRNVKESPSSWHSAYFFSLLGCPGQGSRYYYGQLTHSSSAVEKTISQVPTLKPPTPTDSVKMIVFPTISPTQAVTKSSLPNDVKQVGKPSAKIYTMWQGIYSLLTDRVQFFRNLLKF